MNFYKWISRLILLLPSLLINLFFEYESSNESVFQEAGQLKFFVLSSISLVACYFILEKVSSMLLTKFTSSRQIASPTGVMAFITSWCLVILVFIINIITMNSSYKKWKSGIHEAQKFIDTVSTANLYDTKKEIESSVQEAREIGSPNILSFTESVASKFNSVLLCFEKCEAGKEDKMKE